MHKAKKICRLKRDQIQKEIDEANKQLEFLSKSKTVKLSQLDALKKKIRFVKNLSIRLIPKSAVLEMKLKKQALKLIRVEEEMVKLKNGYANMIRFAHKNQDRYQRLMFIFASVDFNQAYKRIKYLQQINEFRRGQAVKIDSTQNQLARKRTDLEVQKNEKTELRNTEVREKQNLDKEKKEQDKMIAKLQDREKKLKQELAEKQKAKAKLERALEALIRKEIEAAKKKAVASGKKNVTSKNVFSLTPEAQKLSENFSGNKGSFPWPVEAGAITRIFWRACSSNIKRR